jgi:hypothetical protein
MSENENESTHDSESTESTHDSESAIESQLMEITEFEHKIRLLRWGMVVGTLLIIALGVINIINKVQRAAKPALQIVENAKTILPEAQKSALAIEELVTGSDRFDEMATNFRNQLSGLEDIPERVSLSARNQLVQILNDRDDKLRELFPALTEKKLAELTSALARIGEERGDDVLISLFAEHITEVDAINRNLQIIHVKEASNITLESNMQAGLMLVSSVLELLVATVNDLKENIDDTLEK